MNFEEMSKIDVTTQVEKKGKFSYLSWPYAVAEFRKACPDGTWEIKHFTSPDLLFEYPYCVTEAGCFVEVTVIPDTGNQAIRFTQVHPVLDNRNNTISEPNAFQINTSIQRCLVKAIALATGIGLYIYAGEDLPPESPKEKEIEKMVKSVDLLAGYTDEIDKLNSADEIQTYTNNVYVQAKKELSQVDYDKFIKYSKDAVNAWGAGK